RFLSLLELFREGAVGFDQVAPLGELTVRWTGAEDGEIEIQDEFDGTPVEGPPTDGAPVEGPTSDTASIGRPSDTASIARPWAEDHAVGGDDDDEGDES
ncbi:MAG: segregation and condensation protein, partial [Nocardioidaceae bacterium]|nr:segregation and condensation protein [Nocardioidaceae bacterium]